LAARTYLWFPIPGLVRLKKVSMNSYTPESYLSHLLTLVTRQLFILMSKALRVIKALLKDREWVCRTQMLDPNQLLQRFLEPILDLIDNLLCKPLKFL
jgi:hypothetical protein